MTPAAFRAALARLDLSQIGVARAMGVSYSTVKRWLAGETPIPHTVALLLAAWRAHPDLIPPGAEDGRRSGRAAY